MKIVKTLICYGLKHVLGDAADKTVEFIEERLTDASQALPSALAAAHERTWHALGVALAGDSLLDQVKRVALTDATERAVRVQLEPFLRACAIEFQQQPAAYRQACLHELNRLRKSKEFKSSHLPVPANELARQVAAWKRYGDPQGVVEGAWQAVAGVADALAELQYPKLSHLLRQRMGQGSPLLASLFAFFLRQELDKHNLTAGLTFDLLRNLYAAQEQAFAGVVQALDALGDKLDVIFDELGEIKEIVLDIQAELQQQSGDMRRMHVEVLAHLKQLGMQDTVLKPTHTQLIRNEATRVAVRELLGRLQQLPAEQLEHVPALLNGLGQLLVGAGDVQAGDLAEARHLFAAALRVAPSDAARAEIHYNDYRAALENPQTWDAAFTAIQAAATLDPVRFRLFPKRYQAQRILGAGGFGTVFLCHDVRRDHLVAVKSLNEEIALREARIASSLAHAAIIHVYDCDFADTERELRPYIVMEYFAGMNLRAFVEKYGPLTPEQYARVARQLVSGIAAAHEKNVEHRDLKPDNILIRPEDLSVKIIDFGLAQRRAAVDTSPAQAATAPTVAGNSTAGTLAYSAPEQMGRIAGVKAGPYSDVFAFGKTSLFACFNVESPAAPTRAQWASLGYELADLLEKCVAYHPRDRHQTFELLACYFEVSTEPPRPRPVERETKRVEVSPGSLAKSGSRQESMEYSEEGEKILVEVLRGIFDKSGGKQGNMEFSTAEAVCKEYGIDRERSKEITRKCWEQWQKEHPKKVAPSPPLPPPSGPPKEFTSPLVGKFVLAKAGTFWMGDRGQQREVQIPHDFYIGIYPVTQGQWKRLMGNNPSYYSRTGKGTEKVCGISDADLDLFPVECVSCGDGGEFDVENFIKILNACEPVRHWVYRLPTEVEWEYSCRGGATSKEQCGFDYYLDQPTNDISSRQANFNNSLGRTSKVGSYKANALGVFDMHGNVWEWMADWFEGTSNPVFRGGSWYNDGQYCRASVRIWNEATYRDFSVGFRLARVPRAKEKLSSVSP